MRLRNKFIIGIASTALLYGAADAGLNIYGQYKADGALTPEARHVLVLEEQLEEMSGNTKTQFDVQRYDAIQQRYETLMANPEIRQSVEESKEYTEAWYYHGGYDLNTFKGDLGFFMLFTIVGAIGILDNRRSKEGKAPLEEKQ